MYMNTYKAINLVANIEKVGLSPDLFEMVQKNMPEVGEGQILVKQTHMSLDPAMLGWMTADTNSYIPPVALGSVMRSFGLGEVVESKHNDYAVGDRVTGMMGWAEYALTSGEGFNKVAEGIDAETVLSIFALPGLTATQGLFYIGKPQKGETLVVTGAAGSVGSLVGQLAKADGLTVVGVAGSDEKCAWLTNELGFDGAINYKSGNLDGQLAELTPNGVDVYFENTGGEIQQHIFERMNAHGRIVVCGMIADYVAATPRPGPNWMEVIKKRLIIQGFAMPDHLHNTPELLAKLTPYVMSGQVKSRTHVLEGLESAMTGLGLFLTGENKGKLIVKLVP